MRLINAQEAAWLALMEDEDYEKYVYGVDSDVNSDEPAKKVAWHFRALRGSDHPDFQVLQVIHEFCME